MIGRGTHVRITAGDYAGCYGVVRDLWLDDFRQAQLAVEFWHGEVSRFLKSVFPANYLQLHTLPPVSREQFELQSCEQELAA